MVDGPLRQIRVGPRQRAVRAHAAGVGARVAVAHALEVLRGQQRDHGCSIADAEDAGLRTVEVLLDEHGPALGQAGLTVQQRLRPFLCHHHALARGQTIVLDHVRRPERIEFAHEVGGIGHGAGVRGRDAGAAHDLLREVLAAFEAGSRRRRAEGEDPGSAAGVHRTGHQWRFRTDDHQVVTGCQGCDRSRIVDVHRLGAHDLCDPGVARSRDDLTDLRIGEQGHDEGVLPGSGADHQYAHASRVLGVLNWLSSPSRQPGRYRTRRGRHP